MILDAVNVNQSLQDNSKTERDAVFEQLMSIGGEYENDFYLARILSSWMSGQGCLPARLGMTDVVFSQLTTRHFDGHGGLTTLGSTEEVDQSRIPEWEDLVGLLLEFRANKDLSEEWVAQIIATACMGLDHLWQDLGLWSRRELTEILRLNFPELALSNNKDMKWKKFLYKQLCSRDGTYVCRAPSCDVCADYQVCFGPEE